MPIGQIDEALIIANEQRIIGLRERLNERVWHRDDPMKRELEHKLHAEENSLRERRAQKL